MKVLFLSQGKTVEAHPGYHDALCRLKEEGMISDFLNLPYFGYAEKCGWDAFYQHVIELCMNQDFDVVYFHFFHSRNKPSPKNCIQKLKRMHPSTIVITSVGDGFSSNWMIPDYPDDFKDASRLADITFATQMGRAADKMLKWGAKNIVLSPLGMCQKRFKSGKIDIDQHKFDFDVVWIGGKNAGRIFNPFNRNSYAGCMRERVVNMLAKRYGSKFGLFGGGWEHLPYAQGVVPFDKQQEYFRRGRIVVGATPFSFADYYASDRPFFSISSGIPTIELKVPRLNQILRDGEHVYFVDTISDIVSKCDELLSTDPVDLYQKAGQAAIYIAEHHTQYNRLKFELDTARRYVENGCQLDVAFSFFLPEIELAAEKKYAIRPRL